MNVECFRRGEGKLWLYTPYTAGEIISWESIEYSCAIEQIYEDVQLTLQLIQEIENIDLPN